MRVLLVDLHPYSPASTPISLAGLAAVLRGAGHEARVLALGSDSAFSLAGLHAFLVEQSPDLVGFDTYQRNLHHVLALARMAKAAAPRTRVVLGGPQAMFLPEHSLAGMPEVDFLGRGEGELVMSSLVEAMGGGATDEPIPGVTSRTADGGWVWGGPIELPADLDRYPSPWLTGVLEPTAHSESILLTSRGCACRCVFCITPAATGGRIRCHSVDRVLEDISHIASRGGRRLWFADPNFSFDRDRVLELLDGILRRGLEVSMWLETRADLLTPELMTLMVRAGVRTVALGLESASAGVADRLGKGVEPERIREASMAALDAGIDVELFSQFALPGETYEDAIRTMDFVDGCGVAIRGNSNAQQMQLYFGSDVSASPASFGIRPMLGERAPYLSVGCDFETEWMSRSEIRRVRSAWGSRSLDGGRRIVS